MEDLLAGDGAGFDPHLGRMLEKGVESLQPRRTHRSGVPPSAHRLLVPLTQDRCLARLGPGARAVALTSAAHAGRVALIWPA